METALFAAASIIGIAGALGVVIFKNPVRGALSLVISFGALAFLYLLLDAPFLAALQIIIYAGAIMVLFLFVIMLLNLDRGLPRNRLKIQLLLAPIGVILFLGAGLYLTRSAGGEGAPGAELFSDPKNFGRVLFNDYVLPFEALSILLLVAVVGAIVITRRRRS